MNNILKVFIKLNISNIIIRNMSVQETIHAKLTKNLKASHLAIINESYMHNVPKDSETHFKVYIVSEDFKDVPLIKRHRMVNNLLKEELSTGVHALSIVALTPSEWNEREKEVEPSPNCRGGFGK